MVANFCKGRILGKFVLMISVYIDASKWEFDAICEYDWLAGSVHKEDNDSLAGYLDHHCVLPDSVTCDAHINIQEMCVVYSVTLCRSHCWTDSGLLVITDSTTALSVLCTSKSKSKHIMFYLRWLFWLAVQNNLTMHKLYYHYS